ncbi:MAG TPA: hypothetical protein PLN48_06990 [Lachnospiraceae bacterium]|nr:hypothetical protein [Lachnospiraceae bacterium]
MKIKKNGQEPDIGKEDKPGKTDADEIDLDEAEMITGGTMRNNVIFTERASLDEIKK